jgi:hypothetical protein
LEDGGTEMNLGEVKDCEVIKIMIDGGEKLCDYAIEQWIGDKYKLGEDMRRESILRWNKIKSRIRPLVKELRERKNENTAE